MQMCMCACVSVRVCERVYERECLYMCKCSPSLYHYLCYEPKSKAPEILKPKDARPMFQRVFLPGRDRFKVVPDTQKAPKSIFR